MDHRKILLFTLLISLYLLQASVGLAERTYTHITTVGPEGGGYDFTTLQGAIDAMNQASPPLSPDVLGCIEVYSGTYEHNSGPSAGSGVDESKWLPEHCDIVGMGTNNYDVVIKFPSSGTDFNYYVIIGAGDNCVSNVKVYTHEGARNGIRVYDNCSVINCFVDTIHGAVDGGANLLVDGCTIYSMFGGCIVATGDGFVISNCSLYPRVRSFGIELPCGVYATASGTIENVTITATGTSSYDYAGAGLFGIHLFLRSDKEVLVSNVNISLRLTTKYNPNHPKETAILRVAGIYSGNVWIGGNYYQPGKAVVKDCTLNITGIEDNNNNSDPADDGAGIMVDGVCVRGGGKIEIYGDTSITVSRTPASHAADGYVYLLNNYNGTLAVDYPNVDFNPCDPDNPGYPDPQYVSGTITPYEIELLLKDEMSNELISIDNLGNLCLKGNLYQNVTPTATDNDEFRIQNAGANDIFIADMTSGNVYISGTVSKDQQALAPSESGSDFIIKNELGEIVAYIDDLGNIFMRGTVRENMY